MVKASIICVDKYSVNSFSLSISNNGSMYSFGKSTCGSHGHKNKEINIPTQINNLNNIKMIDCGYYHTVCLDYNGNVFTFGKNDYGQLGTGKNKNILPHTFEPQKINLPPCKQVACGNYFSSCVLEEGKLYSFGDNYNGVLASENIKNSFFPIYANLCNIEYIECGGFHIICKTYNNEIYSWGYNNFGQLGHRNNESCKIPIQCLNWPDNIIDIKCGDNHTLLLTSEGFIYTFGYNKYGSLGLNKNSMNIPTLIKDIPEIQRIDCGAYYSLCIDINNNLWIFGCNTDGQLGLGDTKNRYKPILHPKLSNIIDISSGGNHTFVKTIDNKIYAFGNNKYSQLGIETSEINQLTPIQIFQDKEDIWCSTIGKNRAKSARK